jgi:hypothetical protein
MTKNEAIELLSRVLDVLNMPEEYPSFETIQARKAYTMAIKALRAYRDCEHCTYNVKKGNMRGCEVWECNFREIENDQSGDN